MPDKHLNEYARDVVFAIALTITIFIGIKEDIPFIATAFAASAYLSFINPYSIYSTARNITLSYIIAAVYGTILYHMLRAELMTNNIIFIFAIFMSLALFAETLTILKAEHPPAAAVMVSFAYTRPEPENIIIFLTFIIGMVVLDWLFEKLLEHEKEIIDITEEEVKHIETRVIEDIDMLRKTNSHNSIPDPTLNMTMIEKIRNKILEKNKDDEECRKSKKKKEDLS